MKILTILGTRPEIIRLSRIIPRLDEVLGRENHILVHTGQNSDINMSAVFFEELGIRQHDYFLCAKGSFAEQLTIIFPQIENILLDTRPDRVLVLGDTNSSLAAIIAARLQIPVYHMEAGNRSYSSSSPEEVNRRLIDHASSVLLPYTERSRQNLLAEGIHSSRIFVTGNPIKEVIDHYCGHDESCRVGCGQIVQSDVMVHLGLEFQKYLLVTLHREENVDNPARLKKFLYVLHQLWCAYGLPIVISTHPRLHLRVAEQRPLNAASPWNLNNSLRFLPPFGFFDFIALERNAFCVLSDSGTVQEECAILGVPSVTLRDHTERPETIEAGASVLSGADPTTILRLVKMVTERRGQWTAPAEYLRTNAAETVVNILLSHRGAQ